LAGCNLPSRRQATPASGAGSTPFVPPSPPGGSSPTDNRPGPPPTVDGVLAGHVFDAFGQPVPNAAIQGVDVADAKDSTSLDVAADNRGSFKVVGLEPRHQYRVIARVTQGGRLYRHAAIVEPPNVRMVLVLREAPPGTPPRVKTKDPGTST